MIKFVKNTLYSVGLKKNLSSNSFFSDGICNNVFKISIIRIKMPRYSNVCPRSSDPFGSLLLHTVCKDLKIMITRRRRKKVQKSICEN